ncbi:ASKHA domain-containing protein [uncultured Methanoregula sp.]|uniref:ASKHA domain-containing protein n=1 Tax=uncultured Methanoregula sp. TaxID=1005933 RepID=UPI002AAAAD20|nr:ASKHA domain-containing protein [uncultured Methanoregula sp.]
MADNVSIVFHPMNRIVSVPAGATVLEAIRLAGIQFESICGGKGECNKCRIIYLRGHSDFGTPDSLKGLTNDEIDGNYCRACHTHVMGDCEFIIPVESRIDEPKILLNHIDPGMDHSPAITKHLLVSENSINPSSGNRSLKLDGYTGTRPHMTKHQNHLLTYATGPVTVTISRTNRYPEVLCIEPGDTTREIYGVALDLGTTTVVGILVDLTTGRACGQASAMNRQITFGEELLTRISYAKKSEGRKKLQAAALASVNEVIGNLVRGAEIPAHAVYDVCLAGNTVMHHLFLGEDSASLEIVNMEISRKPVVVRAGTLGLAVNPDSYVYCLPNVSRFVGGDVIGDVVASGLYRSAELSLLIDLGTNGEVVLGNAEWLSSVSCASGPAFEGAGISSGMRGMRGAIDHVMIDPETFLVTWTTIGRELPRGICGSGIIDAAAAMVAAGILDFTGKFVEGKSGIRMGKDGPEFVLVEKERTATGRDIMITRQDMAYLIDSKAAACGSIGVLLNKYRLSVHDIRHVYLAGAFGAYADKEKIIRFGILPDFPAAEYHTIGNGSLSGAYALLVSMKRRQDAETVAKKMVYIDLLVDADFIEEYSAAVYIPGKKEYFPR